MNLTVDKISRFNQKANQKWKQLVYGKDYNTFIGKRLLQRQKSQFYAHIISFPKCGRTWLRLLIGKSISNHFELFDYSDFDEVLLDTEALSNLNKEITKFIFEHDDDAFFKAPHELTRSKSEYCHTNVIFLVRDPRDVIVSSYFHKVKRHNFFPTVSSRKQYASYKGSLEAYLYEPIGSLKSLIQYYNIWENNRHLPQNFLLLRYEDMVANTEKCLEQCLSFIGHPNIGKYSITQAIDYASFENMRKLEGESSIKSNILKPIDRSDHDTYKTRRGKVGGYTDYFEQKDIDYMNDLIKNSLSNYYGYS